MYQFNQPKFIIFLSDNGVEVHFAQKVSNFINNLICYCDHPESALRIATGIAQSKNLNLINQIV